MRKAALAAALTLCVTNLTTTAAACQKIEPALGGASGPGFELIDLRNRAVWGTRDWTPEAFAAHGFPVNWVLWTKNDARVLWADRGMILRSPRCALAGEYARMRAFGRDFFHVVDVASRRRLGDASGALHRIELTKFHRLSYRAGREVSVLSNPDGEAFIGVSLPVGYDGQEAALPLGWSITTYALSRELTVDLIGAVSVLRLSNGTSYQGPLDPTLRAALGV